MSAEAKLASNVGIGTAASYMRARSFGLIHDFVCPKCGWDAREAWETRDHIRFEREDIVFCPKQCCNSETEHLHVNCPQCGANRIVPTYNEW